MALWITPTETVGGRAYRSYKAVVLPIDLVAGSRGRRNEREAMAIFGIHISNASSFSADTVAHLPSDPRA